MKKAVKKPAWMTTKDGKAHMSLRRVSLATLEFHKCIDGFAKHEELKDLLPSELMEALAGMIKSMSERQTCKKLGIT